MCFARSFWISIDRNCQGWSVESWSLNGVTLARSRTSRVVYPETMPERPTLGLSCVEKQLPEHCTRTVPWHLKLKEGLTWTAEHPHPHHLLHPFLCVVWTLEYDKANFKRISEGLKEGDYLSIFSSTFSLRSLLWIMWFYVFEFLRHLVHSSLSTHG